jgi:hypothetical protein
LALCSHFLFLYSDCFGFEFHLESIKEMCRIAKEVRIFPLLTLKGERSLYIDRIKNEIQRLGVKSEIVKVKYELQKGGSEMIVFNS